MNDVFCGNGVPTRERRCILVADERFHSQGAVGKPSAAARVRPLLHPQTRRSDKLSRSSAEHGGGDERRRPVGHLIPHRSFMDRSDSTDIIDFRARA